MLGIFEKTIFVTKIHFLVENIHFEIKISSKLVQNNQKYPNIQYYIRRNQSADLRTTFVKTCKKIHENFHIFQF